MRSSIHNQGHLKPERLRHDVSVRGGDMKFVTICTLVLILSAPCQGLSFELSFPHRIAAKISDGDIHLVGGKQKPPPSKKVQSVTKKANILSNKIRKHSVRVYLSNGRSIRYDLRGNDHRGIPTPHKVPELRHTGPTGFTIKSTGPVQKMTKIDIKIVERIMKQRSLEQTAR